MNAIESMLAKYNCKNIVDYRNALNEIIQEAALCGLARGGFFEKAAFYGGTALRIFYGLDRFSEDMDFSLKSPDSEFDLTTYFSALKNELEATGFDITIEAKSKNHWTRVQSAFMKSNTLQHVLKVTPRGIKVNLNHLQKRLEQSGHWNANNGDLTIAKLKQMLCERFKHIDFNDAKKDVSKFIGDKHKLDLWSPEFFTSITNDRLG